MARTRGQKPYNSGVEAQAVRKRVRCGLSGVDSSTSGVDLATKGERETRHNSRRGAQDTDVAQLRHRTGRE